MRKTIYYNDELLDDFSNTNIKRKKLGPKFKYVHKNIFWRAICFFMYFVVAIPLVFIINKILNHQKYKNKKVLKQVKNTGYFIYGNHTSCINDVFSVPYLVFPKRNYVVCNPDATSLPLLRNLVQMLGAIPLADNFKEQKSFINCIEKRINQKQVVTIYPEAHIWPFYTKIRNYTYNSFKYAVRLNKPIFSVTTCYQKRKILKRPKIVSYVDGPFYPNPNLSINEASKELRDKVYNIMCERVSKYSTYEYYQYIKK